MAATATYYDVLYEVLESVPSVILRRADTPPGALGIVQHANSIVTIDRAVPPPAFAGALVQATVDLHRGSNLAPDRILEAVRVREEAARIAVHPALALLDRHADPETLARALGVDVATVLLGIQLAGADALGQTMR